LELFHRTLCPAQLLRYLANTLLLSKAQANNPTLARRKLIHEPEKACLSFDFLEVDLNTRRGIFNLR
jgi:hypothetical protein